MERTWSAVHLWTVYIVPHILLCVNTFLKNFFFNFPDDVSRPICSTIISYIIPYNYQFVNPKFEFWMKNFEFEFSCSFFDFDYLIHSCNKNLDFDFPNTNFNLKSGTQISISILRLFVCENEPNGVNLYNHASNKTSEAQSFKEH